MLKKIVISLFLVGFLGTGIWIYLNPIPLPGCPEDSYLTNFINVYTARSTSNNAKLPGAYFWNFSCLENESFYDGRTNRNIYSSSTGIKTDNGIFKGGMLEGADIESFQILENSYAKDKNKVYYFGIPIKNADVQSFEVVVLQNNELKSQKSIAKDKNYIYMDDNAFKVDLESFNLASAWPPLRYYFKDINNVYVSYGNNLTPIKGANPDSFEVLGAYIAKDDAHVYISKEAIPSIIPEIDMTTFKHIGGLVTADKNHVYYRDTIVENLSPRNFKEIGEGFYKNRLKIYGEGIGILEGVDMETFECAPSSFAPSITECHDKNYAYRNLGGKLDKKPRIK